LLKSDHCADLKLGILSNHTGHFVHLPSLDKWLESNTSAVASPLLDVPIYVVYPKFPEIGILCTNGYEYIKITTGVSPHTILESVWNTELS
jgi:hypothetical protein